MNKNTAILDLMVRRRRNRMIKQIAIVVTFALLIGGMVVYSQQRSFSLTPPEFGELPHEDGSPQAVEATPKTTAQ